MIDGDNTWPDTLLLGGGHLRVVSEPDRRLKPTAKCGLEIELSFGKHLFKRPRRDE